MLQRLEDSAGDIRQAAIECFSSLGAHGMFEDVFYEEIQRIIPDILKRLDASTYYARQTAIKCLSILGAHRQFDDQVLRAIPTIFELLNDPEKDVRQAAIEFYSRLEAQ
ncbi:hypothetical protein H0H87_001910, partial [Tephrocybe sp. NHM501043]